MNEELDYTYFLPCEVLEMDIPRVCKNFLGYLYFKLENIEKAQKTGRILVSQAEAEESLGLNPKGIIYCRSILAKKGLIEFFPGRKRMKGQRGIASSYSITAIGTPAADHEVEDELFFGNSAKKEDFDDGMPF